METIYDDWSGFLQNTAGLSSGGRGRHYIGSMDIKGRVMCAPEREHTTLKRCGDSTCAPLVLFLFLCISSQRLLPRHFASRYSLAWLGTSSVGRVTFFRRCANKETSKITGFATTHYMVEICPRQPGVVPPFFAS